MQINRGLVFWGVTLITAGAVALAIQAQLIPAESARQAWRLWPLLLVVIGLAVIASRTPFGTVATLLAGLVAGGLAGTLVAGVPDGLSIGCGGEPTESVTAEGSFATDGEVELDFSCGELEVSTQAGTAWSVVARHGSDEEPEVTSDADSLRVSAEGGGFIGFTDSRQAWDVVLPTDATLGLTVDSNAASSRLDLERRRPVDAWRSMPTPARSSSRCRVPRSVSSASTPTRARSRSMPTTRPARGLGRDERRLARALRAGRPRHRHHHRGRERHVQPQPRRAAASPGRATPGRAATASPSSASTSAAMRRALP